MTTNESINQKPKPAMKRIKVTSHMIAEIGYDEGAMVLEVKFATNGSIYEYAKVPKRVYTDLLHEKSIGKYFTENIKPNYSCRKLTSV